MLPSFGALPMVITMRRPTSIAVLAFALLAGACAPLPPAGVPVYAPYQANRPQTVEMGFVEAVRLVRIGGSRSGVGASTGAFVGGVGGSLVGGSWEANVVGMHRRHDPGRDHRRGASSKARPRATGVEVIGAARQRRATSSSCRTRRRRASAPATACACSRTACWPVSRASRRRAAANAPHDRRAADPRWRMARVSVHVLARHRDADLRVPARRRPSAGAR